MRQITLIGLLAAGLLLAAGTAQADSIQFYNPGSVIAADSDQVTGGQLDRVPGATETATAGVYTLENSIFFSATELGIPGLTVTVTAGGGDPYHDLSGNKGGFGVFARSDTNPLGNAGSSDNVAAGQSITLTFNQAVGLESLTTFSARHGNHSGGSIDYTVNDTDITASLSLPNGGTLVNLGNRVGTVHTFAYYDTEFYVSTVTVNPVPEPASLALFALGAGGLAVVRRRRRSAA